MLVFKVRVEGSPLGFIAVCVAFALMTASVGLLIASLGKTPEATRWEVDGLDAMTWRGQGLAAAYAPVGLILGASVLFGAIAIRCFDWEE